MNIEEISVDEQTEITLFRAKKIKVESTIGIDCKIYFPTLITLDTGAWQSTISKSIVPPSRRNCFQCFNVPRLPKANLKPFELEGVMLMLVRIGDLEVLVWFGLVNKISDDILIGSFFINRCVRGILPYSRRITLPKLKPFYISAIGRESNKSKITY